MWSLPWNNNENSEITPKKPRCNLTSKQINTLVTNHDLIGTDQEEFKRFATDQTHIVLPKLNGHRKGLLLLFLHESGLIDAGEGGPSEAVIHLHTADLTGADLRNASLVDADLRGANLSGANLSSANLYESSLWGANLRGADLSGAYCGLSDLARVDFSDCNLKGATLDAADLSYATITEEQLASCESMAEAWMPDGHDYEAWLKEEMIKEQKGKGADNADPS